MRRLILDFFSRRWWILAGGALLELLVGYSAATSSSKSHLAMPNLSLQIAIFMGALPFSLDLNKGVARTVATLPLTPRQIGRAWWLSVVGIPAVVISAFLYLGAGMSHAFHPETAFPVRTLATTGLFAFLCLGTCFTSYIGAMGGFRSRFRAGSSRAFSNIIGSLMVGGALLSANGLWDNLAGALAVSAVGIALTAVGWLYADFFVIGRATFSRETGRSKDTARQHRVPTGFGGLSFLISNTFLRGFLSSAGIVLAITVVESFEGLAKSWVEGIRLMAGSGMSFFTWFYIVIFQVAPSTRQLRLLRSLPVSASRLAASMIAIAILPFIGAGLVLAAGIGFTPSASAAMPFLNNFLLGLIPLALCVAALVWRGIGTGGWILMIVIMVVSQVLSPIKGDQQFPAIVTASLVTIFVTLAFLLTRWAILNNSRTYHFHASAFGSARSLNQ